MTRPFYSGYQSARVTRLHLLRDPATAPRRKYQSRGVQTMQGWCSTPAYDATDAPVVWLDEIPVTPPDGLTWCGMCLGRYAEHVGVLEQVAAVVATATRDGPS